MKYPISAAARAELDQAIADEARLAEARKAAWETDPGNTHIAHNIFNARGYHNAFCAWAKARDRRVHLEYQLLVQGQQPANDGEEEAAPCSR